MDLDAPSDDRPLPFSIDLNETPSPSSDTPTPPSSFSSAAAAAASADAYFLARWFHAMPVQAVGPPAPFPGEAGVGPALACVACGRPETRGATLVCDACDRGFHLGCARVRVRQLAAAGDWLCGDCVLSGIRSRRWELGRVLPTAGRMPASTSSLSGKRMLDMNSLPPTDGEVDSGSVEEVSTCRANGGRHLRDTDMAYMGNGVHLHDPGTPNKRLRSSQGLTQKRLSTSRGLESGLPASSLGAIPLTNVVRTSSSQLEKDIFLHPSKAFVSEKQGSLDEGWHVEFKQPSRYAFSCAPDGRRFNSVYEVANYLQISSNILFPAADGKDEMPGSVHRALSRRRRRKELARLVGSNAHTENQEAMKNSCGGEASETDDKQFCSVNGARGVAESTIDDDDDSLRDAQPNVKLPVQFEDFFISSLGRIDGRSFYHNSRHIWPVGYESCWHDRITGSIFKCRVSDGGDSGPLFCVKRYPCSSMSVPVGETILAPVVQSKVEVADAVEHDAFFSDIANPLNPEEDEIQLLLADPCSGDQEIFSCLSNRLDYVSKSSSNLLNRESATDDVIGEFFVEGKSTAAVWDMVSQSFIDACRDAFKKSHRLYFWCKHVATAHFLDCHGSLSKFSYSAAPLGVEQLINNENDLECFCKSIKQWLNQDRFGLDMDFVQEFIEKIPGAQTCAQYELLSDRSYYYASQTVGSGMLCVKNRIGQQDEGKYTSCKPHGEPDKNAMPDQSLEPGPIDRLPPCGRPLQSKIPMELVGDILQIWELFGRFHQILGLEEPLSLEELEEELINPWSDCSNFSNGKVIDIKETASSQETNNARSPSNKSSAESESDTLPEAIFIPVESESVKEAAHAKLASLSYGRCSGVVLTKAHVSLLKVLVGELQCRVAVFADPNYDVGEPKPRRGRRKESESSVSIKKAKISLLPLNELTWPELARRYVLAVSAMDFNQDSADVCSREGSKVFRCLQGDGGILCGSITGVAGMEADALLLAEAGRRVSVPAKHEHVYVPIESKETEAVNVSDMVLENGAIPEWAQVLEPVRKLPTNVGTRIRKCVYESLDRNPPDWARKILEHSISKEVYKGNASGPTKKAVLSVLAEVSGESLQQKPKEIKEIHRESLSILIMKLCRIILRRSMAADEAKVFCNLLGTTLLNSSENDDEGILGSPGQIPRPLDFRTIDLRLAFGAYGGHYEAFLEDVCELWNNIRTVYGDRSDLIELAESLSQTFESLFKTEVVDLVQQFLDEMSSDILSPELQKKVESLLSVTNEMPKAPWEDGVCKVCGIDKDDDSVLLCDTCDSEYHTYCLDPPLSRIPAGNWYCPACVSSQGKVHLSSFSTEPQRSTENICMFKSKSMKESLQLLAMSLENKEYWDLSLEERIFLLKFLCDEILNSVVIREKIDQCMEVSSDLQMKLRLLATEWRDLRLKETTLVSIMEKNSLLNDRGEVREEHVAPINGSQGDIIAQCSSGLQRRSSISLESQENGSCSSIDKKLSRRILKRMNEKSSNGNATELCNLDGYVQSNSCMVDVPSNLDSHLHDNTPKHDGILPTSNSSKVESREIDDSFSRSPKRQKTDCALNNSESTETTIAEKQESLIQCNKQLDESMQLSDPGCVSLDVVGICTPPLEAVPVSHENSLPQDNHLVPVDIVDLQPCKEELDILKNEMFQLQEKIANIESQIFMASLRRDLIGRDSFGRIFWSMGKVGRRPWLLVDGTTRVLHDQDSERICSLDFNLKHRMNMLQSGVSDGSCYTTSHPHDDRLPSWMILESDKDIGELINCLGDNDMRERELKDCILQWQRLRSSQTWNHLSDDFQTVSNSQTIKLGFSQPCLLSQASILLETIYGPCVEMEADDISRKCSKKTKRSKETGLFRCECLEPVWPARHHCLLCHQTFASSEELEGHNSDCSLNNSEENKENELVNVKGPRLEPVLEKEHHDRSGTPDVLKHGNPDAESRVVKVSSRGCPYDFEETCRMFITKDSNKELVKEIGLIGSNGFPMLLESPSFYWNNSCLLVNDGQKHDAMLEAGFSSCYNVPAVSTKENRLASGDHVTSGIKSIGDSMNRTVDNLGLELPTEPSCLLESTSKIDYMFDGNKSLKEDGHKRCSIPESSLRLPSAKVAQILKRLKMNLLDMDAALPMEAFRSSVTASTKRRVWRAFVKSAESIYEMVQASLIFESMIRSEYLKNGRWYWSSVTAAARTPTISSLALRIFSLDASILYRKADETEAMSADNPKFNRVGKRRKDVDSGT